MIGVTLDPREFSEEEMKIRPAAIFSVFAILSMITAAACGGGGNSTQATNSTVTSSTSTVASGASVSIVNFAFSPATLNVALGTTVIWTNNDSTTHTVTSDTGVFNSGGMGQNATFSYTFNTAGTYTYYCSVHTYMKGTVVVK